MDFRLPTAKVLYECNENVDPLTTFFRVTKIIHWRASEFNLHVCGSVDVKIFEITLWKFAMVQLE